MMGAFGGILISILAVSAAVLLLIFVLVPLFKGVGWLIGGLFRGIGWFFAHIFGYIFGTLGDVIRFVGGIPVFAVFGLMAVLNIAFGRWSAAGHFAAAAKRECHIGSSCLYRILLRRPLQLFMLHGLLEGFEQRLPEAMGQAPGRDQPTHRTGQFTGYKIVGSLKGGGSGGKLYIAKPDEQKRAAIPTIPDRVVIKSFALSDGSSLPQIVRESRALECAKQLGHVVEHHMDEHRFYYVMPYIPGDHLGTIARDLHGRTDGAGLGHRQLAEVMRYTGDLLETLAGYHEGGFWHKDVKPDNVIVHDGRAHLVDLGLVTSLGSPMTLTTHGTEYFRDPEMVRQALRGVKVHQVNGAKFDIFAAGAVLYFMLENTFPAHGVLSKFHKKSPEALHWIVRRAMAEYNQRYSSAREMLLDLQFVASAADPFKVKPADLPSMTGAELPETPAAEPVKVFAAASPRPPRAESEEKVGAAAGDREGMHGFGVAAGIGAAGPFAQVGRFHVDDEGRPFRKRARGRRPRLRVTNWWTGEYEVEDPGSAGSAFEEMEQRFAERSKKDRGLGLAFHAAREEARRAHRSAREQLKSARQRAHEVRRRAMARRHEVLRAPGEKPGPMLYFLAFIVLVGAALVAGGFLVRRTSHIDHTSSASLANSGRSVFVINDYPRKDSTDEIPQRVHEHILETLGGPAQTIIQNPVIAKEMRGLLTRADSGDSEARARLDSLLADQNAAAVIWFEPDRRRRGTAFTSHIHVPQEPAPEPDIALPVPSESGLRLIVLNDHPALRDRAVIEAVKAVREAYEDEFECEFTDDLEAEGAVRIKFDRYRISPSDASHDELAVTLEQHGLDGIVHITSLEEGGTKVEIDLFETSNLRAVARD